MRTEIVVTDRFPETASSWLRRLLDSAIRSRGTCSVALAGGSTPRAVYERLVRGDKVQRPWICSQEIDFFFGDERCVPPDHEESNYRMATEALGSSPSWRFHRIAAERQDREQAAREYAAKLPEALDLIVLGIGEDGHTASLFPGSPALDERTERVVVVQGPKPPPWRITIAPPVIEKARAIIVLAKGEAKASAVARALEGPWEPKEVPAQLARAGNWILDREAAMKLEKRKRS